MRISFGCFCLLMLSPAVLASGIPDELKIKREQVFEFAQKPRVTRDGDKVTITFTSKASCDATVAIENTEGQIVRHLASGVLGKNAPAPFKKNSKAQTLVWDGKDDAGKYVDDKDSITVRVSLGLKPRFERTLFWSPKKRSTVHTPLVAASPEGVYVYDGGAVDHLRLFSHDGEYVRTAYPFPAASVGKIEGLRRHAFPHDGKTLPLKGGFHQATLLPGGSNYNIKSYGDGGKAGHALAVQGNRIALVFLKLQRLATDGSIVEFPLLGNTTGLPAKWRGWQGRPAEGLIAPRSAAFSPDGQWIYTTGFGWCPNARQQEWLHVVTRQKFSEDTPPKILVGNKKQGAAGDDERHFKVPTSVDVDAKGRVYVSDYMNDRIQVFTPDGKLYKSIKTRRPAQVCVNRRNGEIYVFSWLILNRFAGRMGPFKPTYTRFGPVEKPSKIMSCPFPLLALPRRPSRTTAHGGLQFRLALDAWAESPTVWLARTIYPYIGYNNNPADLGRSGILLIVEQNGKLVVKSSFHKAVVKTVVRHKPPVLKRQRLHVNPTNHRLYIAEGDAASSACKSVKQLVEVDPENGKLKLVELPFDAEDMCFDPQGRAYLRSGKEVVRYDHRTWREVPWDYGEQRASIGFSASRDGRRTRAVGALITPGHRSHSFWHLGGIDINVRGHLVVTTCNGANPGIRAPGAEKSKFKVSAGKYTPTMYPGRYRWGEIHIFDQHGKVVHRDAFPGLGHMNGIGLDRNDNVYVMASGHRIINGKKYDPGLADDLSETLMKAVPGKAKVVSTGRRIPVPVPRRGRPERSLDIGGNQASGGPAWVDGAEWFYGGVGYAGKNAAWASGGCCCWNARFDLDYFARSFAPEPRHFSVAVLDANGNLILRVGSYGNVDDGRPCGTPWQNAQKRSAGSLPGEPPNQRSIGGDEVGLFHACYVATDTDRRLFIADAGNARIISVKLGYHATESVALKDVAGREE